MREDLWAYIAGSKRRSTLYTGITNDLERRMWEHKNPTSTKSFAARYRVTHMLWCERFPAVLDAFACEKRIKGLTRAKKVAMITEQNPQWIDLSADWYG
jgi:putative endonuclease